MTSHRSQLQAPELHITRQAEPHKRTDDSNIEELPFKQFKLEIGHQRGRDWDTLH